MRFAVPLSQPSLRCRINLTALVVAGLLSLAAGRAHAEQFVLFDAMFTYTWDEALNAAEKSHFFVTEKNFLNKARPASFISPVDYTAGKVHIRAEVIDKPPGNQMAGWALCYVDNAGNYGCPYTDYYTKVGVYERDADMHTFYNASTIKWSSGIKEVDLVYTINGSGSGHITNFPALKDLTTPTTVRISMIQVSMGATYDPSILPGVGSSADGGTVATGKDAAADATSMIGDAPSGGTGGQNGSGGDTTPPASGSGGGSGTGGSTAGSGGSSGTTSGTGGAPGSGVSAGAGCSVGAIRSVGNSWFAALAAVAVTLLVRRRRLGRRRP